jgi:hypothetical protein
MNEAPVWQAQFDQDDLTQIGETYLQDVTSDIDLQNRVNKIENLMEDKIDNLTSDPDDKKSFYEIVSAAGFITEVHPVITADGYKLTMFRIKSKDFTAGRPVAFLQHGIVDSADCWIMNYAAVAPAFQLVRAGYDVWLGNARGN